MDKLSFEEETNKEFICHGFGCYRKAIKTIEVFTGRYGTIKLSLCQSCSRRFR